MRHAYVSLAHGQEIISDEPIPIPKGCVYVTFAMCGEISTHSYKIMKAFDDISMRDMLRDPVKYLEELTDYFGESLHVHYPEAEDETSRTYYDIKYRPFFGNKVKGHATCFTKKSGLYRLGDIATFKAPVSMQSLEVHKDARPYTAAYPCESIPQNVVKYLYKGSLHPTLEEAMSGTAMSAAAMSATAISFQAMKHSMKEYTYLQSWAFEKWPGVHYNFACRVPTEAKKSPVARRRKMSINAAKRLLSKSGTRRSRYTSS